MRKFLPVLLMVAVLSAGVARAGDEIAFVDLQEIFKQFYKTQMAKDQIRQQADDIKFEREEMEAEVLIMREAVELLRTDSRDETLSEEVRESKRDQLEEQLVELQRKEKDSADFETLRMKQMEQQNTRMTKKLFDEIHESVINYARGEGYISVIDRSAQSRVGTDMVLFVASKVDITADVLLSLNEGHEIIVVDDIDTGSETEE